MLSGIQAYYYNRHEAALVVGLSIMSGGESAGLVDRHHPDILVHLAAPQQRGLQWSPN
jgi:hypothetical protein